MRFPRLELSIRFSGPLGGSTSSRLSFLRVEDRREGLEWAAIILCVIK